MSDVRVRRSARRKSERALKYFYRLCGRLYGSIGKTNSEMRASWVKETVLSVAAGQRILDAGAGEMKYREFCQHLHYVSQDFAQYHGEGDGRGLQEGTFNATGVDIVSDITDIPQPDTSFDVVLCSEVFEHLPEPLKAIAEFSRLLKPGGQLILTAPVCSLTHYAPYFYYTGYSRYFYERALRTYGFNIESLMHNGNWFQYLAQELHRIGYVAKRYSQISRASLFIIRVLSFFLLCFLFPLSRRDRGSEELVSFGIHLRAVKRSR